MGTHIIDCMKTTTLLAVAVFAAACAHKQKTDDSAAAGASSTASPVARPGPLKHEAPSPATAGADDDCTPVQVHFALDSSQLESGEARLLEKPARCLGGDHARHAVVGGHADERGTEEYNLALGDRRAQSAKKYLESLGVEATLSSSSMGEEMATGSDESTWSRDRRVDFQEK